jgi:hypothetical protein
MRKYDARKNSRQQFPLTMTCHELHELRIATNHHSFSLFHGKRRDTKKKAPTFGTQQREREPAHFSLPFYNGNSGISTSVPYPPNTPNMIISPKSCPSTNSSYSSSQDELPARLSMITFQEPVPAPPAYVVTPEPPRLSGSGKRVQRNRFVASHSQREMISKKRKHDTCFRSVHFQQDPCSGRMVRKSIFGRVELTEEEKVALWWDKQALRKSIRHDIRMFKSNKHGEGPSCEEFTRLHRQARDLCSQSNSVTMEDIQMNLSDVPIRGLEPKIFPELASGREDIIRKVVAAQDKLPTQLSHDQQSRLLRGVSQNLTRSSRLLARLNGIGDAHVARIDCTEDN